MNQSCNEITNFMGEKGYKLFNPLNTLKLVSFSSFLGEPSYYQPVDKDAIVEYDTKVQDIIQHHLLMPINIGVSRNQIFFDAVNASLDFDFGKTLALAVQCRNEFLMRRSTAQILAIAAGHPNRVVFNKNNPKVFRDILVKCWLLPSDAIACLDAWKSIHNSKAGFPSFIKRAYDDRLKEMSSYQQEKYRKDTINMVRLSHASKTTIRTNDTLSTLMENGYLELDDKSIKWETHRSMGKSWLETLDAMEWNMPHMAALRNIRGFAASDPGVENMKKYLDMLLKGVIGGKQFPFRYITAYEQMKICFEEKCNIDEEKPIEEQQPRKKRKREYKPPLVVSSTYKDMVMDYLEKCLQVSIENYPQLEGNVISLSDNSGSAHGTMTSSYGSCKVSDIGNLSALFTAYRASGRGVVGIFGDELKLYEVTKTKGLLEQYDEITKLGNTVGGNTENGVWLFFKRAFNSPNEYKFDHWFCYSDMQVGHGGLYGRDIDIMNKGFVWSKSRYNDLLYLDIHKCINKYRMDINPKINTYMVQTAGYNNTILPETTYRGAILTGWTGNEVVYAKHLCKLWDEMENI